MWGGLQLAFIYNDWTHWQAAAATWMAFLLTVLEEALLDESMTSRERWRKAAWIGVVAVGTGKLALS